MKKILFIALLAFGMTAKAQITLEHVYDSASTVAGFCPPELSQLMIINFAVSGYQYVKINRCGKCIDIYDMSHALVKTISLANLPADSVVYNEVGDILYISQNLFSIDSKIDFMYCFEYVKSSNPIYVTNIYNENSALIFSDTSAPAIRTNYEQQQLPIYYTPEGTKMILSCANGHAKVFDLPGTLTVGMDEENKKLIAMQSSVSNAYPNPNNGSTKIDYSLPPGVNEGEIVFYNLQGNEVKRFKVNRTFNTLLISTKDIAAGTYYYQLQTTGQSSEGKKMVVIK
jgi:Secretion system C-terminal sorting domain